MLLFRRLINELTASGQYSLKKVSIVVVFTFLCGSVLSGCTAEADNNQLGISIDSSVADNEQLGINIDSSVADNEQLGMNIDSSVVDQSSINAGVDNEANGDAENTDGSDTVALGETSEGYGEYPLTVVKNYQWQCDGEGEYMYLLTNPNVNVALRGAGLDTDISVSGGTTCIATVIVPIFLCKGDIIEFAEVEGTSRRIFYAELDRENCVYTCTYMSDWQDSREESITVPYDTYLMIDYSYSDTTTEATDDIDKSKAMTDAMLTAFEETSYIYRYSSEEIYKKLYSDNEALLSEIEITEGRSAEGNPYLLIFIPSELSDGSTVSAQLQQTSWMEYYSYPTYDKLQEYDKKVLFRSVLSPMMYSQVYHTGLTINAGLFNIFSNTPQGQTIIDGKIITNNPMKDDIGDPISPNTECYALTIDAAGMLDFAKHSDGTPYRTIDANELLSAGITDAITGWGCIVYEGKSVVVLDPSRVDSGTIFYEKVHRRKVAHQVIGQDDKGNYYILSTNDVDSGYGFGLNYDEAAEIMIDAGATFAYMLDGGDSVATVVDGQQITTIYYEDYGKPVPTVINFVAK